MNENSPSCGLSVSTFMVLMHRLVSNVFQHCSPVQRPFEELSAPSGPMSSLLWQVSQRWHWGCRCWRDCHLGWVGCWHPFVIITTSRTILTFSINIVNTCFAALLSCSNGCSLSCALSAVSLFQQVWTTLDFDTFFRCRRGVKRLGEGQWKFPKSRWLCSLSER